MTNRLSNEPSFCERWRILNVLLMIFSSATNYCSYKTDDIISLQSALKTLRTDDCIKKALLCKEQHKTALKTQIQNYKVNHINKHRKSYRETPRQVRWSGAGRETLLLPETHTHTHTHTGIPISHGASLENSHGAVIAKYYATRVRRSQR